MKCTTMNVIIDGTDRVDDRFYDSVPHHNWVLIDGLVLSAHLEQGC